MTSKRIDKLNIFLEFVNQKLQFTYPWTSIKDVQATVQKKPSALKREHPALQNMNFLNFLFLWVIFALLDPDPVT
jgi:hypothetical protein